MHNGPKEVWIVHYLIIVAACLEQVTSRGLGNGLSFGTKRGPPEKYNLGYATGLNSPFTPSPHPTQPPHPHGAHRKPIIGSISSYRSSLRREPSGKVLQNPCFVQQIICWKKGRLVLFGILLICAPLIAICWNLKLNMKPLPNCVICLASTPIVFRLTWNLVIMC